MKTKSIYACLGLVVLTACSVNLQNSGAKSPVSLKAFGGRELKGADETQLFLSQYMGKFIEPDFREKFIIVPDGSVSRIEVRQVGGGSGSQVPYPTVCSYIKIGKITLVEKRDITDRQRYMDFATHVIEVQFSEMTLTNELESSTTSNPNCITFLTEMKNKITRHGNVQYSYYSELLNDDSFRIQTAGGGDYQEGGVRTPSTLDEVYTKQVEPK